MAIDDTMKEAVQTAVANAILDALNGPQRDAIIVESVKKFLGDWSFKRAIEEIISERAKEKAKEILASGAYDDSIDLAIRDGFDMLTNRIPAAVAKTIQDAMFGVVGKDSYSTKAGLMVKHLKDN